MKLTEIQDALRTIQMEKDALELERVCKARLQEQCSQQE